MLHVRPVAPVTVEHLIVHSVSVKQIEIGNFATALKDERNPNDTCKCTPTFYFHICNIIGNRALCRLFTYANFVNKPHALLSNEENQ